MQVLVFVQQVLQGAGVASADSLSHAQEDMLTEALKLHFRSETAAIQKGCLVSTELVPSAKG